RDFMKCPSFAGEMAKSDQALGVAHPPHNLPPKGELITLDAFDSAIIANDSYTNQLDIRRSLRAYDPDAAMTQAQLAFMLWSAQGIQEFRGPTGASSLRPAPSGGARHPFELYAAVRNVDGLAQGIYRYVPTANVGSKAVAIEHVGDFDNYPEQLSAMVVGQKWAADAPVVLFLSCVAYRAEWRYRELAHRVVLIDLGHVGQNIMLSAVALGLGSCCMAAYNQAICDEILGLDGTDEYTVYVVSVGAAKG
ncbi:MAG: SagB/ThcOx family dehydrogenase, partial [Defluviitaleaceae bacterium]|nr:SagB/ThcOx family dehydrogenase [Defluviitaleaceae bacterium]